MFSAFVHDIATKVAREQSANAKRRQKTLRIVGHPFEDSYVVAGCAAICFSGAAAFVALASRSRRIEKSDRCDNPRKPRESRRQEKREKKAHSALLETPDYLVACFRSF